MPDWKGPRASFSRRQTTAFSRLRSADVTTIGTKAEQGGVARSRGSLLQPKEMIRWNLSSGGGTRLEQRQNMAGRRAGARAHTHTGVLFSLLPLLRPLLSLSWVTSHSSIEAPLSPRTAGFTLPSGFTHLTYFTILPVPSALLTVLGHLSFFYRSSSFTQDRRFHSPQRFYPSYYLLYRTTFYVLGPLSFFYIEAPLKLGYDVFLNRYPSLEMFSM